MKRPDALKAGFFTYSIDFENPNFSGDHGETDLENKSITVYNRGYEEVNRETLLHEILHVACHDSFIFTGDRADELEERMIRILSPKLMQYFTDNEDITNYLFKESEEENDETE